MGAQIDHIHETKLKELGKSGQLLRERSKSMDGGLGGIGGLGANRHGASQGRAGAGTGGSSWNGGYKRVGVSFDGGVGGGAVGSGSSRGGKRVEWQDEGRQQGDEERGQHIDGESSSSEGRKELGGALKRGSLNCGRIAGEEAGAVNTGDRARTSSSSSIKGGDRAVNSSSSNNSSSSKGDERAVNSSSNSSNNNSSSRGDEGGGGRNGVGGSHRGDEQEAPGTAAEAAGAADSGAGGGRGLVLEGEPYRLTVMAHSLGGLAMMIYLTERARKDIPHHVSKVILMTPAGFHKVSRLLNFMISHSKSCHGPGTSSHFKETAEVEQKTGCCWHATIMMPKHGELMPKGVLQSNGRVSCCHRHRGAGLVVLSKG